MTNHKPVTPLPWADRTARVHHEVWGDNRNVMVASVRNCTGDRGNTSRDAAYIAHVANTYPKLIGAMKGALAALSQPSTFPADIEAAKTFLSEQLRDTGETAAQ